MSSEAARVEPTIATELDSMPAGTPDEVLQRPAASLTGAMVLRPGADPVSNGPTGQAETADRAKTAGARRRGQRNGAGKAETIVVRSQAATSAREDRPASAPADQPASPDKARAPAEAVTPAEAGEASEAGEAGAPGLPAAASTDTGSSIRAIRQSLRANAGESAPEPDTAEPEVRRVGGMLSWLDLVIYTSAYLMFLLLAMYFLDLLPSLPF